MGVQNCSSQVRGFLQGLFNEASTIFLMADESKASENLSMDFLVAAGTARMGSSERLNKEIEGLVTTINGLTDPKLKGAADGLRQVQKAYYGFLGPQEKKDLGTYSNGIF